MSQKQVKLDRIDLKILRELQKDGRITNVSLAQKVGISAPPCLRRVRALEESGYIRGYHADIAPAKMGFGLTVIMTISLANHSEADINGFAKYAETCPFIRQCFCITGECDFMVRIVAEDWDSFQKFLTSMMNDCPNVRHVRSFPVIRRVKFESGVPIDENNPIHRKNLDVDTQENS